MSKPQPSWQRWMPDDLNPPAAVFENLLAEKSVNQNRLLKVNR
ncbi:hypothetical protein ABC733_18455 [Mangrovibacter sp. SLW1]